MCLNARRQRFFTQLLDVRLQFSHQMRVQVNEPFTTLGRPEPPLRVVSLTLYWQLRTSRFSSTLPGLLPGACQSWP